MPESLPQLLLPITGGLFLLGALFLLISLRLFRRSRTDVYWRHRRQAGQRGWRLFVMAFVLLVISGIMCGIAGLAMIVADDNEPDSAGTLFAAQPTETETPFDTPPLSVDVPTAPEAPSPTSANTNLAAETSQPTKTSQPTVAPSFTRFISPTPPNTVVVIVTATPVTTLTPTQLPTFTPMVTFLYSTVTPLPYAQLRITALDDQITDDLRPVNPRQTFPANTVRLYLFVDYRSMTEGVMWRRELLHNGRVIETNDYLWGLESSGNSYFFFGSESGFEPGNYEIRVYIGTATEPASTMTFIVAE